MPPTKQFSIFTVAPPEIPPTCEFPDMLLSITLHFFTYVSVPVKFEPCPTIPPTPFTPSPVIFVFNNVHPEIVFDADPIIPPKCPVVVKD